MESEVLDGMAPFSGRVVCVARHFVRIGGERFDQFPGEAESLRHLGKGSGEVSRRG